MCGVASPLRPRGCDRGRFGQRERLDPRRSALWLAVTLREPALDDESPSITRSEVRDRCRVFDDAVDLDRLVQRAAVLTAQEVELAGLSHRDVVYTVAVEVHEDRCGHDLGVVIGG